MIQRVVFFRKKDEADQNLFETRVLALESLPSQISEIGSWTVSVNNLAGTEWGAILMATFLNAEEMQQYSDHPAHVEVAQGIGEVSEFAVFDLEI